MEDGFCIDIEADALYLLCTKIWYMRLTSLDKKRSIKILPFQQGAAESRKILSDWLDSFPDGCKVVFHNGLGFDLWVIWKLLGLKPRVGKGGKDWLGSKHVEFVDTYVLSMFLNPDSPQHSLHYLSSGSENEKMDFRAALVAAGAMEATAPKGHEFSFYHPIMDKYCDDDVAATIGVFEKLWKQAKEMYGVQWPHKSFRQITKDYWLYQAQAYAGVKFHKGRAVALVERIEAEMDILRKEVEPHLPPRPLKAAEQAFYKIPAKPFKGNGEFSATFLKWLDKHAAKVQGSTETGWEVIAYNKSTKLVAGEILPLTLPMEIDDNIELKDYFIQAGWKPSEDFWNLKKGPDGKPERDSKGGVIKTTPKIQHQGQICPNLLKIEGDIPKKVVKFLSLRNRLGVVRGWLENWRLDFDGRLSAEISGYTPTSRVRHKGLVNVPKADVKVLLGAEMRDLFTVEEGNWYNGTDAAALENRTLASYTYKYDDGWFARMNLEGDVHTYNAFVFFPHLESIFDKTDPELKENKEFKPWRNKAKTGAYLLAFGGSYKKLASSLGLSEKAGKEAYENYWKMNKGLGALKEAVEKYYSTTGKSKHIPGKDGRLVSVRGKNVLISCLGQGLGAICMSYAACFMDTWLGELEIDELGRPYYNVQGKRVRRISMVHDEYSWEVADGLQDYIKQLSEKAIVEAGKFLKLDIPLAAEAKAAFNGSWKDVH